MKLIDHVLEIRQLIQQAFDNRFSRMGLRAETATPFDTLTAEQQARRHHIENILNRHKEELKDYKKARQTVINECVFTLFNRIAAIKVMEAKELFPEIIRRRKENAGRSFEHNAWLENHPDERNAEREGLKHFLADQFNNLGEHIPLYRKDYPYDMLPTADELNDIIDRFNAVDDDPDCGEDTWKGDDILGWLYENFNAVEKAELKESGDKTEYDKVSLQSQVYTPQWVVKFLVDNTLGKAYLEMFPDSPIKEKYKIANAPTKEAREPKDMREIKVLDPACGSGNFLIYAFDLLYDLYVDQIETYGKDYSRRDIPKMIVENNLYGIDLDERAAQISQIALFIKARVLGVRRGHWPEYTNVVSSHFYLDDYEQVKSAFESEDLDTAKRDLMKQIWGDLSNAYKFGSLVRVEESLDLMAPNLDSIFAEYEEESIRDFKQQFTARLRNMVAVLGGARSNQYTLAKNNDAISFLEIISQSYDVVVANPPYTDSADFGKVLKTFVDDNYKKPYKVNSNLYSCFIKRCCELADDKFGKVGMIHPHTFMYIKTFEDVRKFIIEKTHINTMVDYGLDRVNLFGPGILLDATFYTLDMNASEETDGVYFGITTNLQEKFKKDMLASCYADYINGKQNDRVYTLPQSKLTEIKSWPFIYWISDEFRKKFDSETVDSYMNVVQGLATGDNNHFLRYWWEITDDNVSTDYISDKKKWVRYAKGGPFNKWYGNNWTLVNWGNNGYEIKHFVDEKGKLRSRPQNIGFYFREGITYPATVSKGASFRYLPKNNIIDAKGSGIYMNAFKSIPYSLGFFNSKLSFYICNCLNPTVDINQGDLLRVPFVLPEEAQESKVSSCSQQNVSIKKYLCEYSIIEYNYKGSPITKDAMPKDCLAAYYNYENALLTQVLLNEAIINSTVFDIYELSDRDRKMVIDKEGESVGDLSVSAAAKAADTEWLQGNSEFPASDELLVHVSSLPVDDSQERINDFESLYTNNYGWEQFCIKHHVNPIEAWYQFKNARVLPPQRTQSLAFELLVDVVRAVLAKDDDGIIPLSDKLGEERLAMRVEREMMGHGYSTAQFSQVCQLLGCDLEKFLRERFFQQLSDHLNLFMYLPKTPFIWHLSSGPHHALELYVSIYKWNRDALYRVRAIYAANQEAALRDRLNSLDISKTEGRMEAQELRAQLEELVDFCGKIDDLLASGYNPTLDDGVGKNIAPLQKRNMISYEVLNTGQLKKYLNADW